MLRPNPKQLGVACCTLKQQLLQQQRLCWIHSAPASSRAYKCAAVSQNSSMNGIPATEELLTSHDLQQYISRQGIQASLVPQPVNISPCQVVKSMVLIIKDHHAPSAGSSTMTSSISDADSDWTPAGAAAAAGAAIPATPSTSATTDSSSDNDETGYDSVSNSVAVSPQSAVLVLLAGEVRVNEAAVAEQLRVPKRRLRLASREEAAAVTGYAVGAIPPFGHGIALRTLIDDSISRQQQAQETLDGTPQQQQQQPHLLYAGGGDVGTQLLLSVEQLLAALPTADMGTFAEQTAGQQAADVQAVQANSAQQANFQQQQQQQQQQQWAAQLPLPWPAGSTEVHLIGIVAQRRRIAKLLLFASLVPEGVPQLPPDGTAAYVRRLWRHPDRPDTPCEVQIIMGKTIERAQGREATAALMDQVKVGSIVSIKGHVQPHPAAAQAAQGTSPNGSNTSRSSSSSRNVLDVVAHDVSVLHKSRGTLARAVRTAQRQGAEGVKTAVLQLQQQQPGQEQGAQDTYSHHSRTVVNDTAVQTSEWGGPLQFPLASEARQLESTASGSHCDSSSASSSSSSFATATARGGVLSTGGAAAASMSRLADDTPPTAVAAASSSQEFWQLQLPMNAVHWVCDLHGIQEMQQLLLQYPSSWSNNTSTNKSSNSTSSSNSFIGSGSSSTDAAASDSTCSSSSSLADAVVGMDCEWKPYERGSPASPVALLQLATREHVFLVDMLAICQQQQQQAGEQGSRSDSGNGSSGVLQSSAAAEAALGQFLLQLLCNPAFVKVGFQLTGDLDRLQQSYPHLACFQPTAVAAAGIAAASPATGAAPLVNYVDLLQLSRLAMPSLVKVPHISLSKLVQLVLGQPLDKAQQTSSWDARPLSLQQQVYAANDAHVLTCLYDELLRKVPEGSQGRVLGSVACNGRYLPVTKVAADADVLA